MSHILEDRVLETTTTTGTGDITLAGAITGFRAVSAVCAIGDTLPYYIEAVDSLGQPTGDYEYGTGTYSALNTLTRTTVRGSSNGGVAVNFAAGSKNVGISLDKYEVEQRGVPAGAVMPFAMSTVPSGWLECDGTLKSRTTYARLFAAIGTTFGAGDGATTFAVPDLRAEFVRGWDNGRGVDAARALGSAQTDMFEAHTHNETGSVAAAVAAGVGSYQHQGAESSVIPTSSTGGSETRPRNVALMYCIKT
jgi:microcystin-dependent protein